MNEVFAGGGGGSHHELEPWWKDAATCSVSKAGGERNASSITAWEASAWDEPSLLSFDLAPVSWLLPPKFRAPMNASIVDYMRRAFVLNVAAPALYSGIARRFDLQVLGDPSCEKQSEGQTICVKTNPELGCCGSGGVGRRCSFGPESCPSGLDPLVKTSCLSSTTPVDSKGPAQEAEKLTTKASELVEQGLALLESIPIVESEFLSFAEAFAEFDAAALSTPVVEVEARYTMIQVVEDNSCFCPRSS